MNNVPHEQSLYLDLHPDTDSFLQDVILGLSSVRKTLPSKYFYDERGSRLFDSICELDEYYPTRTETSILQDHIESITNQLGDAVILVEYGSGSSNKTRLLLESIPTVDAYVPIDISREHLLNSARQLNDLFPSLNVLPVCADYSQAVHLGLSPKEGSHITAFFPGSTIGNFEAEHAITFLNQIHNLVGVGGGLLVGADLVKDIGTIEAAYNDSDGVTAAFNLNLLQHINDRLDGDFNLEAFTHKAVFNTSFNRIEMYLVSTTDQIVQISGQEFHFRSGESILTEFSHKYTLDGFKKLVARAGFRVDQVWMDAEALFSVQYLTAISTN